MGTIWVRELTGGLDTRRMPEMTPGGSLIKAVDGHINRGGEFEQRAAFVHAYTLPNGTTKSLGAGKRALHVFGSAVALGIPIGLAHQRLQHPDGVTALVRVESIDLYAGAIYAIGVFADGSQHHFYDGARVTDWIDARARKTFKIEAASNAVITGVTVGTVEILGASIPFTEDNEGTAMAIAAGINTFGSNPEYTATTYGNNISIMAADTGTLANGLVVQFHTSGEIVITPVSGPMTNGQALAAATFQAGLFARTVGSKVYALSGPRLHSSGVSLPTKWNPDSAAGASFKDLSSYSSGAEDLIGFAPYQNFIAVFAARMVQIWYVDPDPDLDKRSQTLSNTGTESPRSITQFGDSDLFYCDASGLRSLRARDSSNAASTSDIGIPVDSLIKAKLAELSPLERRRVLGVIEPGDGRFWLIFPDEIFVFSYFPGSKVSAWSTYLPTTEVDGAQVPFEIEDVAVYKGVVYIRSTDDKIYSYGGTDPELHYDNTEPEIWLPSMDADTPTLQKEFAGIDAAAEGTWEVRIGMQPTDQDVSDKVGTLIDTTFNHHRIGGQGTSTHFSIRLRGQGHGAKRISSLIIHYNASKEESN